MTAPPTFVPTEEEEPGPFDGAGIVSSAADLHEALTADRPDVGTIGSAAGGLALDALAFVRDPFDEAATAGFGWLIEHVDWLREPLDRLAGDPAQITARATDWYRGATVVATEAAARARPDLGGWQGPAADGAVAAAARDAADLDLLARGCTACAEQLIATGGLIGAERALIRDAIAGLLWDLVKWALTGLATAGVAVPAIIATAVAEAATLALRIARRITDLMDLLDLARAALARVVALLERIAARVEPPDVGDLARDAVVELGKEGSGAVATIADQRGSARDPADG